MSTTGILIILVILVVFGGGYYVGPIRPAAGPNNIVGLVVAILIIALLLRLLGIV